MWLPQRSALCKGSQEGGLVPAGQGDRTPGKDRGFSSCSGGHGTPLQRLLIHFNSERAPRCTPEPLNTGGSWSCSRGQLAPKLDA